jgi:hypothetical protein
VVRPPAAAAVAVALAALVLAGCGDKGIDRIPAAGHVSLGTVPPVTTGATTGPTSQPVPAPAPTDQTAHQVGESVRTAAGNTVILHSWNGAVPGGRVAGDVEVCATGSAAQVDPSLFSLVLGDATSQPPDTGPGGPVPAFTSRGLVTGQCQRGWITFALPAGQAAAFLVFRGTTVIRWSLA